jgi:hypothetical protein
MMSSSLSVEGVLESLPSWSIAYNGVVYADARNISGIWYYRDPLSRAFIRAWMQEVVLPLSENNSGQSGENVSCSVDKR